MQQQQKSLKVIDMKKKFSDVYNKIRFAKLDPKHQKAGPISTDDEEHYAVDSQEFAQQVAHVKKRAMQEEYVEESNGKSPVKGGSGTESDPHTAHVWSHIHDFGTHMHNLAKKSGKPVHYVFNNQKYKATPESKGFKIKSGTGEIIKEQQGMVEVWKGHSDTVKNPNFNDELSYRRVNPVGKRLKSGKLSADERGSQERLKSLMKYTQKKGGLAGPKGVLPEQGVVEGLNEMDKSAPQPGRDGKVSHSTYGSRDKKGSDYFKGKELPAKQITVKKMEKDALEILKKQGVSEDTEQLDEKNKPTNPELWSRAISMAKSKFDVYPSAYANGWASKWYKSKGGGWKSVKESKEEQEYDYEGDMAMSDLRSILHNAKQIHDMLKPDSNIPEWCQSKITLAEDYISTVSNYMRGEMNEEVEQIDEISQETKDSYTQKAKSQVAELKPHTKGEYGDIAKRMIARRKKGISMAKVREQIDFENEKDVCVNESRKTDIVRQAHKNQKMKKDKFQSEPVISSTVVKADTSATGQ